MVAPAPPGFLIFLLPLLFCLCLLLRFLLLLSPLPGLRVSRCSLLLPLLSCLRLPLSGLSLPLMLWAPLRWFGDSSVALGSSHFSVAPFLLSLTLRCCLLPQLSFHSALLRWAPLQVPRALPVLPRAPLLALVAPLLSLVLLLPFLHCASATPSAPPLSKFDYGPDVPLLLDLFILMLPGATAPVPPPLSASARADVRRMYQYLLDLLPQAKGSS